MKKTEILEHWFCDICGAETSRNQLTDLYGKDLRPDYAAVTTIYHRVDVCVKCQSRPMIILVDMIKEKNKR